MRRGRGVVAGAGCARRDADRRRARANGGRRTPLPGRASSRPASGRALRGGGGCGARGAAVVPRPLRRPPAARRIGGRPAAPLLRPRDDRPQRRRRDVRLPGRLRLLRRGRLPDPAVLPARLRRGARAARRGRRRGLGGRRRPAARARHLQRAVLRRPADRDPLPAQSTAVTVRRAPARGHAVPGAPTVEATRSRLRLATSTRFARSGRPSRPRGDWRRRPSRARRRSQAAGRFDDAPAVARSRPSSATSSVFTGRTTCRAGRFRRATSGTREPAMPPAWRRCSSTTGSTSCRSRRWPA